MKPAYSERQGMGISRAEWKRQQEQLELEAFKMNKGKKRTPLPGWIVRLGSFKHI